MYLATLDCATSNPSFSSSPWMRGAPHSGFSMLICRISARSPVPISGRPAPRLLSFHLLLRGPACPSGVRLAPDIGLRGIKLGVDRRRMHSGVRALPSSPTGSPDRKDDPEAVHE